MYKTSFKNKTKMAYDLTAFVKQLLSYQRSKFLSLFPSLLMHTVQRLDLFPVDAHVANVKNHFQTIGIFPKIFL